MFKRFNLKKRLKLLTELLELTPKDRTELRLTIIKEIEHVCEQL